MKNLVKSGEKEYCRQGKCSGRPLRNDVLLGTLEKTLNRRLRKKKTGPKKIIKSGVYRNRSRAAMNCLKVVFLSLS